MAIPHSESTTYVSKRDWEEGAKVMTALIVCFVTKMAEVDFPSNYHRQGARKSLFWTVPELMLSAPFATVNNENKFPS